MATHLQHGVYGFVPDTTPAGLYTFVPGEGVRKTAVDKASGYVYLPEASLQKRVKLTIDRGKLLPESEVGRKELAALWGERLKRQRERCVVVLRLHVKLAKFVEDLELAKALNQPEEDLRSRLYAALESDDPEFIRSVARALRRSSQAGANKGLVELDVDDNALISDVNEQAGAYADERAAEMVGMTVDEEEGYRPNPDAKWNIEETTRNKIRDIVADSFAGSSKMSEVSDEIQEALEDDGITSVFSQGRADNIARTEISNAQTESNLLAWRETGLVEDVDFVREGVDECEVCDETAAGSPYEIDDVPTPGMDTHPNCECLLIIRTIKEAAARGGALIKYVKAARKLEGRLNFQGLMISIENDKGSVREGVDKDGKPWSTTMTVPYGYIRMMTGVDGDHVDCFIGPNPNAEYVYVVHQVTPHNGVYDEDKCMLGFDSAEDAERAFFENYNDARFFSEMTAIPMQEFKSKVLATLHGSHKGPIKLTKSGETDGGWVGVDLDGTLVELGEWQGPGHVGPPIKRMCDRVRAWLKDGVDVRIFTARVAADENNVARQAIERFCVEQFGRVLPITCQKDYAMLELWDDRAVQVEPNTGERVDAK